MPSRNGHELVTRKPGIEKSFILLKYSQWENFKYSFTVYHLIGHYNKNGIVWKGACVLMFLLAHNETPWNCWKQGNTGIVWKRHCQYCLHSANVKQLPGTLGVVITMDAAPTRFFLKGDSWTLLGSDSSPYGLGEVRGNVGCTFSAYLHKFFSMQNVSVYNLIVVGSFFFLPLLIHMQMTHTCSCAVLIICVLLSVCPAGSGSKGEERREFILLTCKKTHSCRQKSNSKQHTRVATEMKSSWLFSTLCGNDGDLRDKRNSRASRQIKMSTLQELIL